MLRRKRKKTLELNQPEGFELDLTPIMSFMVTLIPIMLLSTVFVRVTLIETQLPQIVQQAIEKDREKKDREVTYSLGLHASRGYLIEVKEAGRLKGKIEIPKQSGEWDTKRLQTELVQLKKQHPEIFQIEFAPAPDVAYDDIVKAVDEARTIRDKAQKVTVKDTKTNEQAQTDVMFPDVVFAGIVEG